MKTTEEVLGIAEKKKLGRALNYVAHQKKQPLALMQWLTEALEEERKAG